MSTSAPKKPRKPKKPDPLLASVLEHERLRRLGAVLVHDDLVVEWIDTDTREYATAAATTIAAAPDPDVTGYEPSAFSRNPEVAYANRCCEVLPWKDLRKILPRVRLCWPADKVKLLIDAGGKLAYACEHLRAVARHEQGENYADCDVLDSLRWAEEAVAVLTAHGFDPDAVACGYLEAIREFKDSEAYTLILKDEAEAD